MKVAIMYDSKTGNTKRVGQAIQEVCQQEIVVYCGPLQECVEADLYFIGSWTDKGNCSDAVAKLCQTLHHKKIAVFATCGFGGSKEYQENLYQRFVAHIPKDNTMLDHFYCVGEMPMSIRERYVSLLQTHPDDKKLAVSIENFDEAISHPNSQDIEEAKKFASRVLEKVRFSIDG